MIRAEQLEAAGGKIDVSPVGQSVAVPASMRRPWRLYVVVLVVMGALVFVGFRIVNGGLDRVLGGAAGSTAVASAVPLARPGATSRPVEPRPFLGIGGEREETKIQVLSVGGLVARMRVDGAEYEIIDGDLFDGVRVAVAPRGVWWGNRYLPCSVPAGSNLRVKASSNGAGGKSALP